MNFKPLFIVLFLISICSQAQTKKNTLFTVVNTPVSIDEFNKVFNKNRDIVAEENKKSIEDYLELYINYKLKLKQAYELKYDTISVYKKELNSYREQLITPYLTDSKITDDLVKEAYDRMKIEVNASHILISLPPKASPQDTLKAYQKIIEARLKIINGSSFEEVAKAYSEDPSAQNNGGNLGYFSVFDMVYPFENVAFNTKEGEVSMPFKTKFGYHIVKVNKKRASKGEIEVAHIMIKDNVEDSLFAKTKIKELYTKVLQGDSFKFLAKMHSDDKNSAVNGGAIPKFKYNRMIKSFADVAFSLNETNKVSKPFKTQFGWHIVKLIKKHPIKAFDQMHDELTQKIEKNERAKIAGKSIVNKLMNKYTITKDNNLVQLFLKNEIDSTQQELKQPVFIINGAKTQLNALVDYSKTHGNTNSEVIVNDFLEIQILNYFKDNLEKTDADFAFTMQEYRDGLLLFDLLQDKVWNRAENDTIALKVFFDKNAQKYYWPKRGDVTIASCTKKDKALLVQKYLKNDISIDEIKRLVNEGPVIHVIFTKRILEEGDKKLPTNFKLNTVGVSNIIKIDTTNFVIIKTNKIMHPEPMEFKKAKGRVINDFQEYIEKQWIKELRQQYPVKINKRALKKVIKQNQN
ncbi:MAG TPA: peptidylprolyl isomerase [Flavobacteriaceae bacterium]|jgi:peptidyl-prolyl cis-trans isomerase SurA|nr:peptidylprolyl isomerase [Flavobacteriaceae bacterium]